MRSTGAPILTLAAISMLLLAPPAIAQSDSADETRDDAPISNLDREPVQPREVAPVTEPGAAVSNPDDLIPPDAQLVRQGAYLTRARGRLVPLAEDRWAYIFDADDTGKADPPMLVMPCLRLAEMRRIVEARTDVVTFHVSGEVFVYAGRNHFLPQSFTTLAAPRTETPNELEAADRAAVDELLKGVEMPDRNDDDPAVEELLQPFAEDPDARERPAVSRGAGAGAMNALRREGTLLVLQPGRMTQPAAGRWLFTIDNDAEESTVKDRPLVLQPCRLLEDMGRLARVHGEQLALQVSGRVFVYEGENYLLPTMFTVAFDRGGNINPAQ